MYMHRVCGGLPGGELSGGGWSSGGLAGGRWSSGGLAGGRWSSCVGHPRAAQCIHSLQVADYKFPE